MGEGFSWGGNTTTGIPMALSPTYWLMADGCCKDCRGQQLSPSLRLTATEMWLKLKAQHWSPAPKCLVPWSQENPIALVPSD